MNDPTAEARRALIAAGIDVPDDEPCWNTVQLQHDFEVISFAAPFVWVKRRSDGKRGTLMFVHEPRVYFDFVEDKRP